MKSLSRRFIIFGAVFAITISFFLYLNKEKKDSSDGISDRREKIVKRTKRRLWDNATSPISIDEKLSSNSENQKDNSEVSTKSTKKSCDQIIQEWSKLDVDKLQDQIRSDVAAFNSIPDECLSIAIKEKIEKCASNIEQGPPSERDICRTQLTFYRAKIISAGIHKPVSEMTLEETTYKILAMQTDIQTVNPDELREIVDHLLEIEPNNLDGHFLRLLSMHLKGEGDSQLTSESKELMRSEGGDFLMKSLYFDLPKAQQAYSATKDPAELQAFTQKFESEFPGAAESYYMRTIAAAITGNELEMRAQLEAALKIDPTNTRYLEVQKALDEKRTPEFDLKADLFGMPVN